MKFVNSGGSAKSRRGDRTTSSSDRDPRRKDRPDGDSAPSTEHVVFDPFVRSRRRGSREGRVYTPYNG
jgi:hypothetical protein